MTELSLPGAWVEITAEEVYLPDANSQLTFDEVERIYKLMLMLKKEENENN